MTSTASWEKALASRDDLEQFGASRIGLFALALRFGVEDVIACAADALVDGGGDRKNDLIFVDEESGCAAVMQCYHAARMRQAAPSDKAADLNTAMTWVLATPKKDLPKEISSQAKRLRDAIASGTIRELHVLYVHNCPESANVDNELKGVSASTRALLDAPKLHGSSVSLFVQEVGSATLERWYMDTHSPIIVSDECRFKCDSGFDLSEKNWDAFVTAVRADELRSLYKQHGTRLFSANVRDYLGSRSSESNINYGIKKTLTESPTNFWVFNNGVTAITNKFKFDKKRNEVIVQGISIVNGAQTTGAIASALETSGPCDALVPIRFVSVSSDELVADIVQFNNSQNQITASDFRSTDPVQRRLKKEMSELREAEYEGGRRGGVQDAIKRRANLLPSYTVGQALTAFHGNPLLAYNGKSSIWNDDRNYSDIFNERTTARHIVFVFGLLRSIETARLRLRKQQSDAANSMKKSDQEQLAYFHNSGSIYVLIYALSESLEDILDDTVPDKFKLAFGSLVSPKKATEHWTPIVQAFLPLVNTLTDAFEPSFKRENVERATKMFRTMAKMARDNNRVVIDAFARRLKSVTA